MSNSLTPVNSYSPPVPSIGPRSLKCEAFAVIATGVSLVAGLVFALYGAHPGLYASLLAGGSLFIPSLIALAINSKNPQRIPVAYAPALPNVHVPQLLAQSVSSSSSSSSSSSQSNDMSTSGGGNCLYDSVLLGLLATGYAANTDMNSAKLRQEAVGHIRANYEHFQDGITGVIDDVIDSKIKRFNTDIIDIEKRIQSGKVTREQCALTLKRCYWGIQAYQKVRNMSPEEHQIEMNGILRDKQVVMQRIQSGQFAQNDYDILNDCEIYLEALGKARRMTHEEYLTHAAEDRWYGTNVEVVALAQKYERTILVRMMPNGNIVPFQYGLNEITLEFSRNHYTFIRYRIPEDLSSRGPVVVQEEKK